ncbi:hypothetical protein V1264_006360 [Littorina saxatilis]|uniref:Copper transport protein n=1 Tax=Littorina saxatilis TaxID=31220 RepID=A0AAN9AYZ2_9CAEN
MASGHHHSPQMAKTGGQDSGDLIDLYHSVFHTGHSELLLFPSLLVTTHAHMAAACVVVFLVALLYEGLRLFVSWLQLYSNTQYSRSKCRVWLLGTAQTLSFMVHSFVGYCLMLIFMTLNIWLCLSVILGTGTGFVLFHFPPVKTRLFRIFRKGGNNGEVADDDQSEVATVGYEQLEEFKLSQTNAQ